MSPATKPQPVLSATNPCRPLGLAHRDQAPRGELRRCRREYRHGIAVGPEAVPEKSAHRGHTPQKSVRGPGSLRVHKASVASFVLSEVLRAQQLMAPGVREV